MFLPGLGLRFNLYAAAAIANLASFSAGCHLTWTSPTLVKLQAEDSWLPVSKQQGSWIGSLIALGAAFGPIIAALVVDRLGRKMTLLVNASLFLISWAILYFVTSVEMLYVARVIAGLGCGVVYAVVPMYIGEIAEDSERGALGSLLAFFLIAGFLLEYIVGPYTSYTVLLLASAVAPIVFIAAFAFFPESPYFLLSKGRREEAVKALCWLRGNVSLSEVQNELNDLQKTVETAQETKASLKDLCANRSTVTGLYLSCGLVAFQQLSGINVVLFYAQGIFVMAGTTLSSSVCTIIVGTVMLASAGLAPPLVKVFGMKRLLVASALGMAVFQGLLGLYFFLRTRMDTSSLAWLPVTSLVVYIIAYDIGFGPLPWALVGEVFPPNVKAAASAVAASFCWALGFVITKFFGDVIALTGAYTGFWLFTGFCLVAALFTLLLLPDTKGKSLDEIQDILGRRTRT